MKQNKKQTQKANAKDLKRRNTSKGFFRNIIEALKKYKDEVVTPQLKDIKSLLIYDKQYKYYVPISCFIGEDIILTKYNGFCTTFKITNYDLDYHENYLINRKTEMVENIIKRLPENYCIHYETQRKKLPKREFKERPFAPIPTQIAVRERFNLINTGEVFYKTEQYITISYVPPVERFKFLKQLLNPENTSDVKLKKAEDNFEKWFSQQITDFNNQVLTIMSAYSEHVLECRRLGRLETTKYLYNSINGLQPDKKFFTPPMGVRLDDLLIKIQPQNDVILKLENKYCKVISIKGYPDEIQTRVLKNLEDLPYEYRLIHRYIPLGKQESIKALKRARIYHSGKLKDLRQIMGSIGDTSGGGKENSKAREKMQESEDLESVILEDRFSFGYHTFNIILEDTNQDILRDHTIQVKNLINAAGFVAIEDNTNTLDSLAGCVPANMSENLRKTTITNENLISIVPLSDRFQGYAKHPHFSNDGEREESLMVTRSQYDLFDLNMHVGDIGHAFCIGRTGGGKSTFLNYIAMQSMKYKNAKVIYFDVGGSSIPLNIASGGVVYEFGKSKIGLQPFANIDPNNSTSISWAISYTELLISMNDPSLINVSNRTKIASAIASLADTPEKDRTITSLITYLQDDKLKDALRIYSKNGGVYGDFIDSNINSIKDSKFITFEMEHIMKDEKITTPILTFLINYIENVLVQQGEPVFIFFDECWLFLKNPLMANFLLNSLKTFRKKNASCILATQELNDVFKSDIGNTILSQCLTQIYLANEIALSKDKELYAKLNLNYKEIQTIANAQSKLEYFYKASDENGRGSGSILFQLRLTPLELAYVGRASKEHLSVIKAFKEKFKDDILQLNLAWFKYLIKYDQEHPHKYMLYNDDVNRVNGIFRKYKELHS